MVFGFEKLIIYKRSIDFASLIYKITKSFPDSEEFGLISQLRRAAVSISANIAEGAGRHHKKDFAQFIRMARGSLYECMPLLEISFRESYIDKDKYCSLVAEGNEIAKMLNGLISSLTKE